MRMAGFKNISTMMVAVTPIEKATGTPIAMKTKRKLKSMRVSPTQPNSIFNSLLWAR
jgi:hypothetical protein